MASATRTVTVNAAFFQEIKEVNQDLWRSLRVLKRQCARPSAILNHQKTFLACFEEARDQLALHFALEEAFGYFDDPVDVAPQLCDQAFALRSEHGPLYLEFCELVDRVCELSDGGVVSDSVRAIVDDFEKFHQSLLKHEDKENKLILHEYTDDIGVAD